AASVSALVCHRDAPSGREPAGGDETSRSSVSQDDHALSGCFPGRHRARVYAGAATSPSLGACSQILIHLVCLAIRLGRFPPRRSTRVGNVPPQSPRRSRPAPFGPACQPPHQDNRGSPNTPSEVEIPAEIGRLRVRFETNPLCIGPPSLLLAPVITITF